MAEKSEVDTRQDGALSVVDRVLTSFVDAVAADQTQASLAEKLRSILLEHKDFSESALERALFEVDHS